MNFLRVATVTVKDLEFSGRISFSIERSWQEVQGPTAPMAKITVYNMAPKTAALFEANLGPNSKTPIRLDAGYEEKKSVLFLGAVDRPTLQRSGSDLTLTLECRDGGYAIGQTMLVLSFDATVDGDRIIDECVKVLGFQWGVVYSCSSVVFKNGFCWADQAVNCLHHIAQAAGMVVSINNGVLNITPQGQGTGEPVVILNETTGLIGSPSKTVDTKGPAGVVSVFSADSMLNPLLTPGRYVRIESQRLTLPALLVVRRVVHTGDTKEGEWKSAIECTIPGAVPSAKKRKK